MKTGDKLLITKDGKNIPCVFILQDPFYDDPAILLVALTSEDNQIFNRPKVTFNFIQTFKERPSLRVSDFVEYKNHYFVSVNNCYLETNVFSIKELTFQLETEY